MVISNIFGVPFMDALDVIPRLLVWVVVFVAIAYMKFLNPVWPLAAATLFSCFTPVLDYKAGVRESDSLFIPDVPWYGHAGWQFLIFCTIVVAGYGIKYWQSQR
jgi:hypothetical protein